MNDMEDDDMEGVTDWTRRDISKVNVHGVVNHDNELPRQGQPVQMVFPNQTVDLYVLAVNTTKISDEKIEFVATLTNVNSDPNALDTDPL